MRHLLLFFLTGAALAACQSAPSNSAATASPARQQTPPAPPTAAGRGYGASVEVAGAVPVQELTTILAGRDSAQVKLIGQVNEVCQAKGCWMTMQTATGAPMRVRFKDYGFFVPKDIAGKTAVVSGWVLREVVPVAEQRHYARDAGRSEQEVAAITQPAQQYNFVADGVLIQ